MLAKRHAIARLQSDFYRDQYRKMLRWLVAAILVMYLLLFAIAYLILFKPTPQYFANTTDGRILSMPPPTR